MKLSFSWLSRLFCSNFHVKRSPGTFFFFREARESEARTTLSKRRLFAAFSGRILVFRWKEKNHIFLIYCSAKFHLACSPDTWNSSATKTHLRASLLARPNIFFAREQCGRNSVFSFTRLCTLLINNDTRHRTLFFRYEESDLRDRFARWWKYEFIHNRNRSRSRKVLMEVSITQKLFSYKI